MSGPAPTNGSRSGCSPTGRPSYETEGQQKSSALWLITLLGDVMLLGMALLYWRTRPSGAQLNLVATGDVERCKPVASIEKLKDGSFVVCGEVSGIEDDAIVLDLGDRPCGWSSTATPTRWATSSPRGHRSAA